MMFIRITYAVQHHNLVNDGYLVQPLGSIPKRSNSLRSRVLSQLAKLIFDCFVTFQITLLSLE